MKQSCSWKSYYDFVFLENRLSVSQTWIFLNRDSPYAKLNSYFEAMQLQEKEV